MMTYYKYKEATLLVLSATIIPALAHFLPFWPMEYGVCFPTTGPSWTASLRLKYCSIEYSGHCLWWFCFYY